MVLFKLLLEPLEIAEWRVKACQHPGEPGGPGRAPALLTEDDLVAAAMSRRRFDIDQWLVTARLHRCRQLLDQPHRDVDARLDRTGIDHRQWQHCDAFRMRRSPSRHAAAPPGGCSGSTRRGGPDLSKTLEPADSARMKARRIRQPFRPATLTGGPECGPGGCPTRRR